MISQWTNSTNSVPAMQKFFQKNPGTEVFRKTPQDQASFKTLMLGTFFTIGMVGFGIRNMATNQNKKKK